MESRFQSRSSFRLRHFGAHPRPAAGHAPPRLPVTRQPPARSARRPRSLRHGGHVPPLRSRVAPPVAAFALGSGGRPAAQSRLPSRQRAVGFSLCSPLGASVLLPPISRACFSVTVCVRLGSGCRSGLSPCVTWKVDEAGSTVAPGERSEGPGLAVLWAVCPLGSQHRAPPARLRARLCEEVRSFHSRDSDAPP